MFISGNLPDYHPLALRVFPEISGAILTPDLGFFGCPSCRSRLDAEKNICKLRYFHHRNSPNLTVQPLAKIGWITTCGLPSGPCTLFLPWHLHWPVLGGQAFPLLFLPRICMCVFLAKQSHDALENHQLPFFINMFLSKSPCPPVHSISYKCWAAGIGWYSVLHMCVYIYIYTYRTPESIFLLSDRCTLAYIYIYIYIYMYICI